MLWLGVNTWLFIKTYLMYSTGQQYHYLYKMLGVRPDTFTDCTLSHLLPNVYTDKLTKK